MQPETEQAVKDLYTNPQEPGSLGGVEALYQRCKLNGLPVSRKDVKSVLKKEEVYTLHKPKRTHYSRNPTIVSDIDKQWQVDLADMQKVSRQNSGFNYILAVIDCFSKTAWAIPVKKKDSKNMLEAFTQLFKSTHPRIPQRLQSDKGKEFLNHTVQELFKQHGVHHFVTENETKASMAERFIRTLKTKIYRWFDHSKSKRYIDVLPEMLKSYNNSYHRTIGMRPSEVTKDKVESIFNRVYGKYLTGSLKNDPKFASKEPVRISAAKTIFDKGYLPNWTDEVFKITETIHHPKKVYKIEDVDGQPVKGTFYPEELQSVTYDFPEEFLVEKVVNTRKRKGITEVLVKWIGYPSRHNSWIPETDLSKYDNRH